MHSRVTETTQKTTMPRKSLDFSTCIKDIFSRFGTPLLPLLPSWGPPFDVLATTPPLCRFVIVGDSREKSRFWTASLMQTGCTRETPPTTVFNTGSKQRLTVTGALAQWLSKCDRRALWNDWRTKLRRSVEIEGLIASEAWNCCTTRRWMGNNV